jgi:hypothetical protein
VELQPSNKAKKQEKLAKIHQQTLPSLPLSAKAQSDEYE